MLRAAPEYPLRDLNAHELRTFRHSDPPYVKFEPYPVGSKPIGRYWTQAELDAATGAL